ncbi:MAG TPA: SBBP repeat-containing protein [Verrucomicrobiae bacterium]|jgi:hypothetical protein
MPEEAGANPPVEITRRVFILVAALLCALSALAPNATAAAFGEPVWTNVYNGEGYPFISRAPAVAVDGSGNVFVSGSSRGIVYDYATIKYSAAGTWLWARFFDRSDDYATAVAVDGSGNVFVTGYSGFAASNYDYVTIKYSGTGDVKWTNVYNGLGNGADYARAIAVDASGNVFVAGSSFNGTNSDYATVAYSGAGVPLWTNLYNGLGNSNDFATALALDGSGNVFVTGWSYGDANSYQNATVAYSGAGVPLWTNRFGGPHVSYYTNAVSVAVDVSGNVFVAGESYNGANSDYATVAYSGVGVPLWTNLYNGLGNGDDSARAIAVDASGNVFVTGYSYGAGSSYDYATVAYSGAGVPLWTNRYHWPPGRGDYARAIAVDGSGNVFVTGDSAGIIDPDYYLTDNYLTVAYSGAGVPLWTNRYIGRSATDSATAIAVDGRGNVLVTGTSGIGYGTGFATIQYAGFNYNLPTITQIMADNGEFQFLFNAESNHAYTVEFRDFLDAGNWLTLTSIAAQPTATNIIVTNAITNDARFFRVRTP